MVVHRMETCGCAALRRLLNVGFMVEFTRFASHTDESDVPMDPRARLRTLMRRAERGTAQSDGPEPRQNHGVARRIWRRFAEHWLPESWLRSRVDPGRAGWLGLLLAGLVVLCAIGFTVWMDQPMAAPAADPPVRPPVLTEPTPGTSAAPAPQPLVVSVVGRVTHPGLVRVGPGARVADALEAAGGPLPETDITTLNLARRLVDGEQLRVAVPTPQGAEDTTTAAGAAPAATDGKLDLNQADAQQLDQLPGIGRVTAERIVQWRTEHGRFTSVEQLREVGGIGAARLSRLRELVRV
jgi:competence protein ComEA